VLKAQCIKNGKQVAIKCMKNHFDSLDQARAPLSRARPACARARVCVHAAPGPPPSRLAP
jgi:hypothetical protein